MAKEYTPFKMKGSPMKRNFGIGEKEEASPGKNILGKVLSSVGDAVQAGIDAGAGTTHLKDKRAKEEKKAAAEDKHKKAMELINAGKAKKEEITDTNNDGITDNQQPELFDETGALKENTEESE